MPNCHECKHVRPVPGDAHKSCHHPDVGETTLLDIIIGRSNINTKLGITADDHGVKSGWFFWPDNFDPVWLKTCNGFTKK